MNLDKISFQTNTIPVLDRYGNKLDEFTLKNKITPLIYRRSAIGEDGLLYKGAGIIYQGHVAYEYDETDEDTTLLTKSSSPYDRYSILFRKIYKKYGIFNFPHQECFSDYEGGCGLKEQNIIRMFKVFERSSIEEIVDVIDTPIPEHFVYALKLKEVRGCYKDTIDLIEYFLANDFNTGWDKNLWSDIDCFGYIRDIADWFISKEFKHKLGTVFSLMNGCASEDKYTYNNIANSLTDCVQLPRSHAIYISALIVQKFSPECVTCDLSAPSDELYRYLYNELYSGKACCHLENDEKWDFVRDEYKSQIETEIKKASADLFKLQIANMKYFF